MLKRWLKTLPSTPGLPDPNKEEDQGKAQLCAAANEAILEAVALSPLPAGDAYFPADATPTPPKGQKRKRGQYGIYTPEDRLTMGKYGAEHGASRAAVHFSHQLSRKVNESTIRTMVKSYKLKLATSQDDQEDIKELPTAKRGRPTLLHEDVDKKVADHLIHIRDIGGVVNSTIVIAAAKGIIRHLNPGHLVEHGGHLNLTKSWAQSLLRRMGWVKRKGTKDCRSVPPPEKLAKLTDEYLSTIKAIITDQHIPTSMVVNFDQTGVNIVPTSNWTLNKAGEKQVPIAGIDDKRQVTMVLANTPTGHLLPPQVVYQGVTDRCHPTFNFPKGWDITHTANHWSNEETTKRYITKVLDPYFTEERERLDLPPDHPALVILDVFAAHRTQVVRDLFKDNQMYIVYVPAGCTGLLQPLDVSGNGSFKEFLKAHFSDWYSDQVQEKTNTGAIKVVDMRLTYLKPKHANWILQAWSKLKGRPELCVLGWKKTGVLGVVK